MSNNEMENNDRTLTKQVSLPSDDPLPLTYANVEENQNSEFEEPQETNLHSDNSGEEKILYGISDVPSWYLCILLGFQHYLTMFGSTVAVPLILSGPLGIANDDVAKGQLLSTIFFASGIATLLQTSLGNRLPIVQGAAFSFLAPAISVFQSIPDVPVDNSTVNASTTANPAWLIRMREVQGAIMVASCTQILLGFTGLIGFLMAHIGPLTIAPTVALVGLGLFGAAGDFAGKQWGIAFLTIFLIIVFSQHLKNIPIPLFYYNKSGWHVIKLKMFGLFPVVLAVLLSWALCAILTVADAFPTDPKSYGYQARTDLRSNVLHEAAWFRVPYPGQWGLPTVSASAVFGMISGVLASIIESVGDYYACARIAGASAPPNHAVNRGILMEGIGCVIAGALGTGNGTTSYSENIGAIGITKVASRRVVQVGAVIMLVLAVIGKFGALFVTIPDPIVGGMLCVMFGVITAVGISSLQFVDLNSSRNLLVFGFSIFIGLTLPEWMKKNEAVIATATIISVLPDSYIYDYETRFDNSSAAPFSGFCGLLYARLNVPMGIVIRNSVQGLDQVILVLLKTGIFIGGLTAFILDNTIPGTEEERGLKKWRNKNKTVMGNDDGDITTQDVYGLPGPCNARLDSVKAFRYLPICPTFRKRREAFELEQTNNIYKSENGDLPNVDNDYDNQVLENV